MEISGLVGSFSHMGEGSFVLKLILVDESLGEEKGGREWMRGFVVTTGNMEKYGHPSGKCHMHQQGQKRLFISSPFQKPWTIEVMGGPFYLTKLADSYSVSGLEPGPKAP